MRRGKLIGLIVIELILAVMLFAPTTMRHKPSHLHAFVAWRQNPTFQTQARWEEENRKFQREGMTVELVLLGGLIINTIALARVFRRK